MATKAQAVDPVCGMEVEPEAALAVEYGGTRYLFCEAACAETFREDPDRWAQLEVAPGPSGTEW
ncbi:MAG: YHS domain-containing protein [Chloroflexi bacterium]|nr:YHS domain-containing protein [Chloroflexota bacterium]